MLHPLLEEYIPSRSYVDFLRAQNTTFTDFETAAILKRIGLPFDEKISVWMSLLEETKDMKLKQQLADEIALEQKALELVRTKTDGSVYMICDNDHDGDWYCLAENYETAYAIGLTYESNFRIEKHRPPAKYRGPTLEEVHRERALAPDDPPGCIPEYAIAPIGDAWFCKDGTLRSVWSKEADDMKSPERRCSPVYFTNAFVEYPFPFERGDIVRYVSRCGVTRGSLPGIVATSQADWAKFLERVRGGLYVDMVDASLTVEWLTEKGSFSHGHVCPIFLEWYEPEKEQPWYALIQAGSELIQGRGSLERYMRCCEAYQDQRKAEKLARKTAL